MLYELFNFLGDVPGSRLIGCADEDLLFYQAQVQEI